jgi:hypothetical protein
VSWTFWLYAPGAVIFAACIAAYARRAPWRARRTRWVAITVMGLDGSLFVVLALAAVLRVVHPPYPVAVAIAICALGAVHLAGLAHLVTILRLTRPDRSHDEPLEAP